MTTGMTEADLAFFADAKKAGVIEKINADCIDVSEGLILFACGDCDRIDNLYSWIRKICRDKKITPRLHLLTLNGGGLLLPSESRINGSNEDLVLIKHAKAAMEMEGIRSAVLSVHYPCEVAESAGLCLKSVCRYIALGKRRLKRDIRSIDKVYAGLHMDFGDAQKTYGVHTKEMTAFIRGYQPLTATV